MKEQIAKFLDLDIDEIKEITTEQKAALRAYTHNLFNMPKYYTTEHIIFTNEEAVNHWKYYAGFQYLDEPEVYKRNGDYIAAYSSQNDSDNRIQDYLNEIQQHETN
jgi:hypothetical protein